MQSFSTKALIGLVVVVGLVVAITAWRLSVGDTSRHADSAPDDAVGIAAHPSASVSPASISRTPLPGPAPTEAEMLAEREAGKREVQQVVEAGKSKLVGQYQ